MAREIKFRIWSNSYNKYIENYARTHEQTFGEGHYGYEGYHLALRPDGKLYDASVGIDYPGTRSEIPTLDWEDESEGNEVEQYTGLKDKNGKEIYEGDVVKMARSYGYHSLPKGALVKVVYDEEELCYKLKGRGEFRLTANKAVEVVGNIHESNMEELCPKE